MTVREIKIPHIAETMLMDTLAVIENSPPLLVAMLITTEKSAISEWETPGLATCQPQATQQHFSQLTHMKTCAISQT